MTPKLHRVLTQVFLVANSLFWLPWGFLNLIWPKAWDGELIPGMDVYDLSSAVARTEVRAMYGGLQMAIGIFALLGAFWPRFREAALVFFVLALTGLAACRFGGMVAEGDGRYLAFTTDIGPGDYNQVGLAMYELPNLVFAWVLLLLRPRGASTSHDLATLRAENERLRKELEAIRPPSSASMAGGVEAGTPSRR